MKSTVYAAFAAALFTTAAATLAGCGDKAADTDAASTTAPATTAPAASSTGGGSTTASATPAVATANPQGSVKVGDKAVCAVCNVKEGSTEAEEVKSVVNYQGKTYAFCNEEEKAEFISNPAKYTQAQ